MSSAASAAPSAKRRRAADGDRAPAAAAISDDPLMADDGPGEDTEAVPEVMVNIFKSATLADIRAANAANGIDCTPSRSNVYMRPKMHFSIVPRAPSMMSRIFEMIAAVLGRSGGREASGSIGFTVVMLNGQPQVAIDVGDERYTFVVSVRITADIYVNPAWAGVAHQFPVFRVRCRSMVEKLSQAKDFNRVILYQQQEEEDRLDVVIDTPERAGNVQHETIKIQADEWESLELQDVTHDYTLQTSIKTLLQLCRMQRDAQGHMSIGIHVRKVDGASVDEETEADRAAASSGADGDAASESSSSTESSVAGTVVVRERQEYILQLKVTNAEGETSSILRPISNEIERRKNNQTGVVTTTMHFMEEKPSVGLDLIDALPECILKYQQSFSTGYIEAFLSKFDPNKMITLRLARDKPMVMSYLHGGLLICQMVVSPVFEDS
jgi:hypothetical protein